MKKDLCFIIEKKDLYLEKVLVDYMDIPIFFICKSNEDYYIALCIDVEEYNYVVAQMSLEDTYALLHGKIAMRDAILKQKEYWLIYSGVTPQEDVVEKKKISQLSKDVLPEKGAYYKILTDDIEKYVQTFDEGYFAESNFGKEKMYNLIQNQEIDVSDIWSEMIYGITVFSEVANCKFDMNKCVINAEIQYDEVMENCYTGHIESEKLEYQNLENSLLAA